MPSDRAPASAADRVPFALVSDIHGNARALEAVLAELERFGVDDGVVLGDVAQGGEEPAAVLDRLADLGWPVILGNADHFLLEVPTDTNEQITGEQLARRDWSFPTRPAPSRPDPVVSPDV
jgi:predicted phosphodiesterase